ncbi:circumsporozoite protein-like [Argiope bruennichi]|uniref:Circumsporozoite protein like n=1 Tax=Argiope bruennichi TaxID=94029 RepID=A0A8T0FLM8_ARGBR|nr:circumsporozoite protein-like [Argiope bruennichi]KAF8791128.1 Circumsporozoite protein like [Argiope bruennichi]
MPRPPGGHAHISFQDPCSLNLCLSKMEHCDLSAGKMSEGSESGRQAGMPPAADGGRQAGMPETDDSDRQAGMPEAAVGGRQAGMPETDDGDSQAGMPPAADGDRQAGMPQADDGDRQAGMPPAADGGRQAGMPQADDGDRQAGMPEFADGGCQTGMPELVDSSCQTGMPEVAECGRQAGMPEGAEGGRQVGRPPAEHRRTLKTECDRCIRDEIFKSPFQREFEKFVRERDIRLNADPHINDECPHQDEWRYDLCDGCMKEEIIAKYDPEALRRIRAERVAATPFHRKECCLSLVEKEVSGLLDDPDKYKRMRANNQKF